MKKEQIVKHVKKLISVILLLLSGGILAALIYIKTKFKDVTFEQILYNVFYSESASFNAVSEGVIFGIILDIIFCIVVLFPFYIKFKTKNYINIIFGKKKKKIQVFPFPQRSMLGYSCVIFCIILVFACYKFGIFDYVRYQFDDTKIFDYYVNPKEINMSFSGKKKNLIYIFAESFEGTNMSISNGGAKLDSRMPMLESLADKYVNFSNNQKLGGAVQVEGLGWTVAGMVAQTSGVPLKVKIEGNSYGEYSSFLPGVYSLGEVLADNGYHNYLMLGSEAKFGGRLSYFQEHGNYEIYDYNWAVKEKIIDEDYYVWWGYEDSKLFKFAKDKLTDISKSKEPFNFAILTADTHFPNGYVDGSCDTVFDINYENSIYCSDNMIYQFIVWIQQQDFYKDTVIVVVGDHLTMQSDLYENIDPSYQRNVYNVFINTDLDTSNNKDRLFTSMDMYPTTLAALGMTIEGNKLGLGTNLFSDEKTLLEELGYDYVNIEFKKKSKFYDNYLLGNTYKEMMKDIVK